MPLRIFIQIHGVQQLAKVAMVVVNVTSHPDLALLGQVHHLLLPHRAEVVFLSGGLENLDRLIG